MFWWAASTILLHSEEGSSLGLHSPKSQYLAWLMISVIVSNSAEIEEKQVMIPMEHPKKYIIRPRNQNMALSWAHHLPPFELPLSFRRSRFSTATSSGVDKDNEEMSTWSVQSWRWSPCEIIPTMHPHPFQMPRVNMWGLSLYCCDSHRCYTAEQRLLHITYSWQPPPPLLLYHEHLWWPHLPWRPPIRSSAPVCEPGGGRRRGCPKICRCR